MSSSVRIPVSPSGCQLSRGIVCINTKHHACYIWFANTVVIFCMIIYIFGKRTFNFKVFVQNLKHVYERHVLNKKIKWYADKSNAVKPVGYPREFWDVQYTWHIISNVSISQLLSVTLPRSWHHCGGRSVWLASGEGRGFSSAGILAALFSFPVRYYVLITVIFLWKIEIIV